MMTLSGNLLTLEDGNPTLSDIALGLSRIPRFGGQTSRPWTVAHHSLVVSTMTGLGRSRHHDELELHGLLHDAHEMMTGDIPTTFKVREMRHLQERLDIRLYTAFGLPRPRREHCAMVKLFDRLALTAEAYCVTPAATYNRIVREVGTEPDDVFIDCVEQYLWMDPESAREVFELRADLLIAKWGTA